MGGLYITRSGHYWTGTGLDGTGFEKKKIDGWFKNKSRHDWTLTGTGLDRTELEGRDWTGGLV